MPFYNPESQRKAAAVCFDMGRLAQICHDDYKAELDAVRHTTPRYRSMRCEAALTLDFHWTDCARSNLISLVRAHQALSCVDRDQTMEIAYPGGSAPVEIHKLDTGATLLAKAETIASAVARFISENPDAKFYQL